MDEELRFHLELEAMHQAHAGLAAPDAERAARLRLGHLTALRDERRHASGWARPSGARSITRSTIANMVALAPMPNAKVRTTAAVKPGVRVSWRSA